MILITGGAYQGKLEYAVNEFVIKDDEVFVCAGPEIDLSAKVLTHFEKYVLACIKAGIDAREYIKENIEHLRDKIIIADDITQGVVPVDSQERAWREETGKCLVLLGSEAERVIRVFCGIAQDIKGENR